MSDFKELIDSILLEDVLDREGVDYRLGSGSRGEQLNIQECPFCGGDEWKVYANRDSGLGNCFHGSCQETFNLYKFTARLMENNGGGKAGSYLSNLAKELGWQPRERKAVDVDTYDPKDWELPSGTIKLPDSKGEMLHYLTNRGVDAQTAKWFDIRYCHDSWYKYIKVDGTDGFMPVKRRVIFPIFDLDGDMVTFQGRDITGKSDRKYLFPPRLPGTGRYLYNGHRAARKEHLILCEGAMDVIGAHNALRGDLDTGVVGSFGMHLSTGDDGNDQLSRFLRLKEQGLKQVTIMWDGEFKAYAAAIKAAVSLVKIGIKGKVASLPKGKDPGEARSSEILAAIKGAKSVTGNGALVLTMANPYR